MRQYHDVSRVVSQAMFRSSDKKHADVVKRIDGLYRTISTHYRVPYEFPEAPMIAWNTELCREVEQLLVEFEEWLK